MFKLSYNCIHFTCYQGNAQNPDIKLQQYVNQELPDVQAGFRKGREPYMEQWIVQYWRGVHQGCVLLPCLFNLSAECLCAKSLQSCLSHCNPWTVAHQTPLFMGFSRQEYWSGLWALLHGIVPTQGSNPLFLCLLHWQVGSLLLALPRKPSMQSTSYKMLGWMNHKLESRLLGEIPTTSNMQMITL